MNMHLRMPGGHVKMHIHGKMPICMLTCRLAKCKGPTRGTHWIMVDVVVEGGGRREEGMVIEGWDG